MWHRGASALLLSLPLSGVAVSAAVASAHSAAAASPDSGAPDSPARADSDGSVDAPFWGPEVHYRMAPLFSLVSPAGGWALMTLPIGASIEYGYRFSGGFDSGGVFLAVYGPGINYAGFRASPQIGALILGGVEIGHEFRLRLSPDNSLANPGFLGIDLGVSAVFPANSDVAGGLSIGLRYTPTAL